MVRFLQRYERWSSKRDLDETVALASDLSGHTLLHVYSGGIGSDLANMMERLGLLFEDLGLHSQRAQITGTEEFFDVARLIEKGLVGHDGVLTPQMEAIYVDCIRENARRLYLSADTLIVHNLPPLGLVEHRPTGCPWVWRCHFNLSRPLQPFWDFISKRLELYDAAVFSHPSFSRRLVIPRFFMAPSIDPLSERNHELSPDERAAVLDRLRVPRDRTIIVQTSSAEESGHLVGLIRLFVRFRRDTSARLVLAVVPSGTATDDWASLDRVREMVRFDPDIQIVTLPMGAGRELNALQSAATVAVQSHAEKRIDLSILEAMWKGKPVVVRAETGKALRIRSGVAGFISSSLEGMGSQLTKLLADPVQARTMGAAAREHVRRHFLVTRHLKDYLHILSQLRSRRP